MRARKQRADAENVDSGLKKYVRLSASAIRPPCACNSKRIHPFHPVWFLQHHEQICFFGPSAPKHLVSRLFGANTWKTAEMKLNPCLESYLSIRAQAFQLAEQTGQVSTMDMNRPQSWRVTPFHIRHGYKHIDTTPVNKHLTSSKSFGGHSLCTFIGILQLCTPVNKTHFKP